MNGTMRVEQQLQGQTMDHEASLIYDLDDDASASGLGFDLRAVIAALRRNLKWVLAIIGVAIVAGIVLTLMITPQYVAFSRVLVNQQADEIIQGSDVSGGNESFDADRFLQTQVDILKGRSLAQRVIASGKLVNDPRFFTALGGSQAAQGSPAGRMKQAVDLLTNALTVNLPTNSRIVSISITSRDPGYSAKLADLYAENFIQANLNQKFESSAYAREFLMSQLEETRARLENSERDLNRYSRAAGLIRVAGQGDAANSDSTLSVTNEALVQTNGSAGTATTDRIAAEDAWRTIANEPLLNIPQVQANPVVQDLLKQKAALEGSLANERTRHLEDYPTIKTYKAQIAELDRRIKTVGTSIKRSIYLNYQAVKAKEDSLNSRVGNLQQNALNEQDQGVHYNLLKRVADTNRALYDALLARYNQISATAGATSNNISLIDRAEVPDRPASPKMFVNLLVAFVLGCLAAAVFVYLKETFDDTIRVPSDVERKLALPLLAVIPVQEEGSTADSLGDPKSSISEAYHSLVVNLRYSTTHGFPKVLVVTSAGQSEGKTTSAYAIAADMARLGRRILLIDADLRRPTLHRRMGAQAPGLTEALVSDVPVSSLVLPSDIENLSYLTALPMPPEPALLLSGDRMGQLIAELAQMYDSVIIDCPPMLGLSDTVAIAKLSDGVLFLLDASGFHRGAVKTALRRLKLINAPILGIVLNKFDPKSGGSEQEYYGYNYYSYGREDEKTA